MNIYAHADSKEKTYPTYFYVHGGGFTWGDKDDGVLGEKGERHDYYFLEFFKAGYDIVSINYAFAPEYIFPTQQIQMGEAMRFIVAHGAEYGLDTSKVVFGGGSAGAIMIGQFLNIHTNPAYAKEMNIEPSLDRACIKAAVFHAGVMNNENFETDNPLANILFASVIRAYLGVKEVKGSAIAKQSSVLCHVTADFPPCFISDGNTATFPDQNRAFAERLTELGILNRFNFYPKSEKILMHGFESLDIPQAQDNLKKALEFLETVV